MDANEAKREFARLFGELQKSLVLSTQVWNDDDREQQRECIAHAVVGVLRFIEGFDDLSPYAKPLRRLREALIDLREGHSPDVLQRTAKAPPMTIADRVRRAYAVGAVDALKSAGVKNPVERVVEAFAKEGVQMDRKRRPKGATGEEQSGEITISRLRKWCEEPDELARKMMADAVASVRASGSWPPTEEDARRIVEGLARLAVDRNA